MARTHKNKQMKFVKSKRMKNNQKTKRSINNTSNKTKKKDYKNFNYKKLRCSPKDKKDYNNFTCYTNESLYKLRDQWNKKHPDKLIKTNDSKEIHSKLTFYLSSVCKTESCWLKQDKDFGKISEDIIDSFAPGDKGAHSGGHLGRGLVGRPILSETWVSTGIPRGERPPA